MQEPCEDYLFPIYVLIEHDTLLIEALGLLHQEILEVDSQTVMPKMIGTGINCVAAGASVASIFGGMALAPITAGASLGLAVGGLAGVLVGSGINLTTDIIKQRKMRKHMQYSKLLGEEHDFQLNHVLQQFQFITKDDKDSENNNKNAEIIKLFIKKYSVDKVKIVSPRNVIADAVTVTGKVGTVLDANQASKIPHVINEIATSTTNTATSAITSGTVITAVNVATGIAITGAVASVGFAVWDVASLIRKWGQNPTADKVQELKLDIEKERDWLKEFFKL